MKIINLRDYYPFYSTDVFLEVSDEVASFLEDEKRLQINYAQYIRDNKAFYSLDAGDGIEAEALNLPEQPDAALERMELERLLKEGLATMQSLMNVTPILARFSISTSTILLGRRNSGIPYFSTPPISCSASNTVTSYPYLAISPAKDSPAGPEPITATLIPFFSPTSGTEICPLSRS